MVEFVMTGTCVRVPKRAVSSLGLEWKTPQLPSWLSALHMRVDLRRQKKLSNILFHHTVDGSEIRLLPAVEVGKISPWFTKPGMVVVWHPRSQGAQTKKEASQGSTLVEIRFPKIFSINPENKSRGVFFSPPKNEWKDWKFQEIFVPEISGDELHTFSDGPIPLTSTVGKEIGEGCRWWSCQDPLNPTRVTRTYLYITPQAWQLFGVIIPRSPSLIEKIQVFGLLFSFFSVCNAALKLLQPFSIHLEV